MPSAENILICWTCHNDLPVWPYPARIYASWRYCDVIKSLRIGGATTKTIFWTPP